MLHLCANVSAEMRPGEHDETTAKDAELVGNFSTQSTCYIVSLSEKVISIELRITFH